MNTSGLTSSEVAQRQIQYGQNELRLETKTSILKMFFEEFADLMVLILVVASIISFAVGEGKDGIIIAGIVLLNACIGFVQKFKAEKAVEALKKMLAPKARVIRDGKEQQIAANRLVPGDLILLSEGDLIPADAKLIEENECQTQEAALTGESLPIAKTTQEGGNKLFMGTIMTHGSAKAVVTATGMLTEFGKIANLTTTTEKDKSPLQKELDTIGIFVSKMTLVIAVALLAYTTLIQDLSLPKAILLTAAIAVAAVPEGLPTTITIALALGVQRLAKKNAIIKQLSSVETLGSTTVIVSDKTGTLTKNEMTVKKLHTEKKEMVALICSLCNKASITKEDRILGDPTEGALLMLARELGEDENDLRKVWSQTREFPFDSNRKRMSVMVEKNGEKYILAKGAPDSIISICNLTKEEKGKIENQNEEGANEAMRMIAFAYKKIEPSADITKKEEAEQNLTFVGLCGMIDPPREEVPEAVKLAKQAGISIYIVTGDHGLTARAIAKKIGLGAETIITGTELEQISDKKLLEIFTKKQPVIFARVSPQDKLRIVSLLKENNEVVAVTGDGVNDAPALKRADIGIAMGITGTDVAKEASNMVLSDDSFSSIVAAIQEGRTIYENLKKFIMYIFSSNIGELVVIFATMLLGLKMPLTAIMILIINIGTDVLPALALGVEQGKLSYMKKPPRDPKKKILRKHFIIRMCFLGTLIGISSIGAYLWGLEFTDEKTAMTMTYATLILSQMFNVCNARDTKESVFRQPFNNPFLIGAIAISILITIATVHLPLAQTYLGTIPLTIKEWLIAGGISAFTFIAEEIRKYFLRRKLSRT